MLSMGESRELCGGTHVRATGDIGLFKILGEQGIAAGVRRILATTGDGSLAYVRELEDTIERASRAAKAAGGQLAEKVEKLVAGERALQRRIEELERKLATGGGGGGGIEALIGRAREIAGVHVLGVRTEVLDRAALRELAEQLRDRLGNSIVLVGSAADDKAQLVLTVAKPLVGRYKAGELIRPIAAIVGGSGGGRPDMAQAGGTEVGRLDQAIEAVYERVAAS
jgi:alanyl-tRNA synthetase